MSKNKDIINHPDISINDFIERQRDDLAVGKSNEEVVSNYDIFCHLVPNKADQDAIINFVRDELSCIGDFIFTPKILNEIGRFNSLVHGLAQGALIEVPRRLRDNYS